MITDLCKKFEHYETPQWAARAILDKESLPEYCVDPCTGTGILALELRNRGHKVSAFDVHDWGYGGTIVMDWLETGGRCDGKGLMMNPPFSLAVNFVEHAIGCGFDKILCFQRFAWWESKKRKPFWEKHPPARVYICGDRAACWRHDIPESERKSTTPTAHAWFVWEKKGSEQTTLSHIWRDE